jgi:ATP-binding cassette subfamily B protein
MTPDAVREKLGCVFQNPRLFSGTVAQNLRWGDPDASEEALREACVLAQADSFIEAMPGKYDTVIERDGRNLSGGQKQRLSIARALIRRPSILLLDDASSALDFRTEARLRDALSEIRQKEDMTIVIVSQRIASLIRADQILVLEEGRMMGIGTHRELLQTCDTYRSIVFSQMSEEEVG